MMAEVCPYCRAPILADELVKSCDGCSTRHHQDCYEENGGCTIFGCTSAPAEEPKLSVSTPELTDVVAQSTGRPSAVLVPAPPPPSGSPAPPPSVDDLRRISNRVVPSMFGSFLDEATLPAEIPQTEPTYHGEPKRRTTFILLGALLGAFGSHNFYAGYTKKALIQLSVTVFTIGFASPMSWIWAIIDICTVDKDSHGVQFES